MKMNTEYGQKKVPSDSEEHLLYKLDGSKDL